MTKGREQRGKAVISTAAPAVADSDGHQQRFRPSRVR